MKYHKYKYVYCKKCNQGEGMHIEDDEAVFCVRCFNLIHGKLGATRTKPRLALGSAEVRVGGKYIEQMVDFSLIDFCDTIPYRGAYGHGR